jgi:large subunit ribosomal protein L19
VNILESLETRDLKKDLPLIKAGCTVKVHVRVVEGKKERIQVYEGIVIAIKGTRLRKSIIVRKVSNGVGVERTFPLHSPTIERVEVVQRGKVRRTKLYYMRNLSGKAARIPEVSREKLKKIEGSHNTSR